MKNAIHPKYFPDATVSCVCGNNFTVGSTTQAINIELCASCHPFYTGKQKLVDAGRRVEKFHERTGKKETSTIAAKKAKATARKTEKTPSTKEAA